MPVIEVLHQIVVDVRPDMILVVQSLIVTDRGVVRPQDGIPPVMVLTKKRRGVVGSVQQPVLVICGCCHSVIMQELRTLMMGSAKRCKVGGMRRSHTMMLQKL